MSSNAWGGVVQNNRLLKPTAVGGVPERDGIRKTGKINLAGAQFVIRISGGRAITVALAIQPSE